MARLNRARTDSRDTALERQKMTSLTGVTVRCGPTSMASSSDTHLSLPFWMEAWPRLALSKSGEFLLRFVLVERTLFCGDGGQVLSHRNHFCPVTLPRDYWTPLSQAAL